MSASNIEPNILDNNKKTNILISNYNNKNNSCSINESTGNYLYKINESDLNNISRENSYNYKKNNNSNNSLYINTNGKLKLKLPVNITNNNYNMNKNNVMINLSTNIISDNLNKEKMKVQQKLVEYRKLIDKKINELMNNKKRNLNQKRKKNNSTFDKDKNNKKSPRNYEIYKKAAINLEQEKSKRKINNLSNTNYKFMNKEYFKNIHDKTLLLPKKINGLDKNSINNNSHKNYKIRQLNKNKLNIVSKNIDEKGKFDINNFEDEKDRNIHDQITSKGNEEEKSEDSKE